MNTNNVISNVAAADLRGLEHRAVRLTSTGINIAGGADLVIGTLLRGAESGKGVDVFLAGRFNGLHFVEVGNNTAIAIGDELELIASGRYVKRYDRSGTAADTGDVFTSVAHGFADGTRVILPTLTGGTGLTALTVTYFVRDATADTFKVALSPGGAAVAISADASAVTIRRADFQAIAWEAAPTSSLGGDIRALLL
jgi:hypothetical protein